MFNIGQYFEKFLNTRNKEVLFRTVVQETIREKVGIEIPVEDISIKSSVVTIKNISQAARSAIFVKKKTLLTELSSKQTFYSVKDIR